MASNWSEMPDDVLYEVAKQLPLDVEDIGRFSCVSKSWRSSGLYLQKSLTPCAALFIRAKRENDNQDDQEGVRSVYSFSSTRVFNLKLPQAQGRRCWGTPVGWILTMGHDRNINLLNPLSRVKLPLPPQHTFKHQFKKDTKPEKLCQLFLSKIALSSNPYEPNTPIVLATYGVFSYLAMATPVDKVWTPFQGSFKYRICDITFLNGHLFVVGYNGRIGICDLTTTPPTATDFAPSPEGLDDDDALDIPDVFYLVGICGSLHLIGRVWKYNHRKPNEVEDPSFYNGVTKCFLMFKFDFYKREWTRVTDLCSQAVFVGNNQSFAISTSDYSQFRGNCIYFTDDDQDGCERGFCDMGIYDFGKNMVDPFYVSGDKVSMFSRPFFFMPTP